MAVLPEIVSVTIRARLSVEAGSLDFLYLVLSGLSRCWDADIGNRARHRANFVRIGCPEYLACSKLILAAPCSNALPNESY
jgi:hypothetical protein